MSNQSERGRSARLRLMILCCAALAGCGGGNDSPPPSVIPPDLSGVWAGPWQGLDPLLGQVTGTLEAVITQGESSASGPTVLLGDVDCMDGQLTAAANPQGFIAGTLLRSPCLQNTWSLTALDIAGGRATGVWGQPDSGAQGSFTGVRIARLDGPRIRFVSPPSGWPGTLVTLVGESMDQVIATDPLVFGTTVATRLLHQEAGHLVAAVPTGATSGRIALNTVRGRALSPAEFNVAPRAPAPINAGNAIAVDSWPLAIATSPDGNKVYVAAQAVDRSASGVVTVVRASTRQVLFRRPIADGVPRGLVTSPDGKRLYAAVRGIGVRVMDAANATTLATIPVPLADTASGFDNPQGIAISPDGRLLAVSDASAGGSVSIVETASRQVIASLPMAGDVLPLGVAFHPRGYDWHFFVAAARTDGAAGTLLFVNPAGAVVDSWPVGVRPTGIAVAPDGSLVFVGNQGSNTLSRVDLATGSVSAQATALAPSGLAASPDGQRIFITNRDSGSVTVATTDGSQVGSVDIAPGVLTIAIERTGTSAFAGTPVIAVLHEIGGMHTLTVALGGTGIGGVTSSPAGITCGSSCVARFTAGTLVTLLPSVGRDSTFAGWQGDPDCADGSVLMETAKTCVAVFQSSVPPPNINVEPTGCFIATAAYGSPLAAEVQALRDFRDAWLLTNTAGRAVVRAYYRYSPPLAAWIGASETRRRVARAVLWPIVLVVAHPATALVALTTLMALCGLRRNLHLSSIRPKD